MAPKKKKIVSQSAEDLHDEQLSLYRLKNRLAGHTVLVVGRYRGTTQAKLAGALEKLGLTMTKQRGKATAIVTPSESYSSDAVTYAIQHKLKIVVY